MDRYLLRVAWAVMASRPFPSWPDLCGRGDGYRGWRKPLSNLNLAVKEIAEPAVKRGGTRGWMYPFLVKKIIRVGKTT
jgi:hypothetical protein